MEVPISYFSEAGQDGNASSLEERIQEIITAAEGRVITLKNDSVITCSNVDELRGVLKGLSIL